MDLRVLYQIHQVEYMDRTYLKQKDIDIKHNAIKCVTTFYNSITYN